MPNISANPNLDNGARTFTNYFNTAAFVQNALGTYGDTKRDFMVGPGYADLDFSIIRSFPFMIRDTQNTIQFRAESFNLANRVNFSNPTNPVSSSAFGTITAANDPRILQFALKYTF